MYCDAEYEADHKYHYNVEDMCSPVGYVMFLSRLFVVNWTLEDKESREIQFGQANLLDNTHCKLALPPLQNWFPICSCFVKSKYIEEKCNLVKIKDNRTCIKHSVIQRPSHYLMIYTVKH